MTAIAQEEAASAVEGPKNPSARRFIPEIDVLRGLAVLMVVIYHGYPRVLPGGYIGVDVFFVISGFVIARSYLFPLIDREISFRQFYLARFRRLAPAALAVVFAVMAFSGVFLLPDRLLALSWSVLAQLIYAQNLVFWVEGDYFTAALTKPLLHTWSLAIEEQFYLVWAAFIFFFRKFPRAIVWTLVFLIFASIVFGYFMESRSPKTVFFLLPFRVWEFCIGILAFHMGHKVSDLASRVRNLALNSCFLVLIVSALFFDEQNSFPGIQSILACGATALSLSMLLVPGVQGGFYSVGGLGGLGKISYGLYLWHWPPLVFFYLLVGHPAEGLQAAGLILVALLLALFSYFGFEDPIRRGRMIVSNRIFLAGMAACGVALLAFSIWFVQTKGLLFRFPEQLRPLLHAQQERGAFRCGQAYVLLHPKDEMCPLSESATNVGKSFLILGDSHADVLKELVATVAAEFRVNTYLTVRNCELGRYGTYGFCSDLVLRKLIGEAQTRGVTDVVAVSYWDTDKFSAESMRKDLQRLVDAGLRVHVVSSVPSDPSYDPRIRAKLALENQVIDFSGISLAEHLRHTKRESELISGAVSDFSSGVFRLDPAAYLCSDLACLWHRNGVPLYLDSNHLTFAGGEVLRPMFVDLFRR